MFVMSLHVNGSGSWSYLFKNGAFYNNGSHALNSGTVDSDSGISTHTTIVDCKSGDIINTTTARTFDHSAETNVLVGL